jgi:hypothetical protein
MKVDDIDLDLELGIGKDRMDATQAQYNLWLRRFCEFCNHDFVSPDKIPISILIDRNMAAFLVARGKDNSNAPHVKKSIISSLNYALSLFGLPNLCDHRDLYQLFDRAKTVILFIDYNNYVFLYFF